jgi:predicted component of type VI protein secretion system
LVVAAGCLSTGCRSESKEQRALTAEAKAYSHNLQLSEVTLKATESYTQQTVTEIEGKITNSGGRNVRHAEVYCVFYDRYAQVVKRERVPIIKTILRPGETRAFRLPFDDLPQSWNDQMPNLVIAGIDFF